MNLDIRIDLCEDLECILFEHKQVLAGSEPLLKARFDLYKDQDQFIQMLVDEGPAIACALLQRYAVRDGGIVMAWILPCLSSKATSKDNVPDMDCRTILRRAAMLGILECREVWDAMRFDEQFGLGDGDGWG